MIENIPLLQIQPNPWQSRKEENPEHVKDLAKSILEVGLLQFPVGRHNLGGVQIAFGHSRLAAYILLAENGNSKFSVMPVNILELTDEQMAVFAFTENEKRKDLNPVERARAVQKMIGEFGWDQGVVADKLGLDRSTISNMLRMLKMPADVLKGIESGILSQRMAMALLPWYELSPVELSIIQSKDPGCEDFIALARSGAFTNSETIRQKVDELIGLTKPDQPVLPTQEADLVKEASENPDSPENEIPAQQGEEEDEPLPNPPPSKDRSGEGTKKPETVEKESPIDGTRRHASQDAPTPKNGAQNTRNRAPEPVPVAVSAIMEGEMLITIKRTKEEKGIVGVQRFGDKAPTIRFIQELNFVYLPAILKDMGIE